MEIIHEYDITMEVFLSLFLLLLYFMVQELKSLCLCFILALVNITSLILRKFSFRLLPMFIYFVLY
jgi:hypothetical protein